MEELKKGIEEALKEYGDIPWKFKLDLDSLDEAQLYELKKDFEMWLHAMDTIKDEVRQCEITKSS